MNPRRYFFRKRSLKKLCYISIDRRNTGVFLGHLALINMNFFNVLESYERGVHDADKFFDPTCLDVEDFLFLGEMLIELIFVHSILIMGKYLLRAQFIKLFHRHPKFLSMVFLQSYLRFLYIILMDVLATD